MKEICPLCIGEKEICYEDKGDIIKFKFETNNYPRITNISVNKGSISECTIYKFNKKYGKTT